ncbi:MAG: GNAT family N-acetyltransferase [Candidatus Limnocylindria bacterium]
MADIEPARPDEAEAIAALLRDAYADHAAAGLNFSAATATAAQVRERIANGQVYVARQDGRVLGTYNLRTKNDPLGEAGYVNSLAIDPALRRTGLGRLLLEHAEAEALRRGLGRMRLDTALPLTDLVGWYERRGYRAVGATHWQGKTYDSVIMQKLLRPGSTGGVTVVEEQRLGGGRSTTVSRVGDTVRRETGPWTPTIHAYLRHLRAAGFGGAPEVLGLDERGREMLSFTEGTTMGETLDPSEPKTEFVTVRPWPPGATSDRALAGIGRLLRQMHDAARDFRPAAPTWREYDSPMKEDEIVTHGDIGPWNVVYRGEDPVAIIDFDGARPQRPLLDLASTAWHCVPLGEDAHLRACGFTLPYRRGERLRILSDAYGLEDRSGLPEALSEVKQRWPAVLRYWQSLRPSVAAQHLRFCADDLDWLERSWDELASHLR